MSNVVQDSSDHGTICCRGTDSALGHPAVYLTFADQKTVQCYYCGSEYTQHQTSNEKMRRGS